MKQGSIGRLQSGFTLLETLIALAIMSLASLALFQSTGTLLRVTDGAVSAGERTLEEAIARKTFRRSIAGLTPAWPEQADAFFKGDANQFSGLSTGLPSEQDEVLMAFSFVLVGGGSDGVDLQITTPTNMWTLKNFHVDRASFSYLGEDHHWYEIWPPAEIPAPGFFDDENFMTMAQLPLAIRLRGQVGEVLIDWIAPISGAHEPPFRQELTDGRF